MKYKKAFKKFILKNFSTYWVFSIFAFLLVIQLFTRFYALETKSVFGWDQVDNAWAAKNIIIDHEFPVVGMQAKGNTGFYIGPYYYYLVSAIYFLTNLDPIASGIIAGITSTLTFLIIYFVLKAIFNEKVALIAIFINTFSLFILNSDRVQWPVNFIIPTSFLIFYSLYRVINGNQKYMLLLAASFGFSLHVHFTSLFYIPIILLSLPFFPRKKGTFIYILYSLPIFIFFVFPIVFSTLTQGSDSKAISYVGSSYHGIHLRRIIQLVRDGFIQFEEVVGVGALKNTGFVAFPLFIFLLLRDKFSRKNLSVTYLSILWIFVPWLAFSTYTGEISDYYFSMTRIVALMSLSYLIFRLMYLNKFVGALSVLILFYYAYLNLSAFLSEQSIGLLSYKQNVFTKIKMGEKIPFTQGDPESYLYYIYKQRNDK